jgi:hypothetical protein
MSDRKRKRVADVLVNNAGDQVHASVAASTVTVRA